MDRIGRKHGRRKWHWLPVLLASGLLPKILLAKKVEPPKSRALAARRARSKKRCSRQHQVLLLREQVFQLDRRQKTPRSL